MGNPLQTGSSRMRLFRALRRFSDGLTIAQIKDKCGMVGATGYLFDILRQEQERKRIKKTTAYIGEKEQKVSVYVLTAKGDKALDDGTVDTNAYAGRRVGVKWNEKRKAAS